MLDILEVVDYRVESPKYVCTRNEQEPKAPAQNRANRILRFGKLEGLVSSVLAVVRGTVSSSEGVLLLTKWRLTRVRDKIHDNSRSCGGG
jgi:hypothetical protein